MENFLKIFENISSFDLIYIVFTVLSLIKCSRKGFVLSLIAASKWLLAYILTLKKCHSTVGIAILNTSITIVFGFSILVLSNFIPTIYFGIFTGIAMLLAMISVLTLLPALLQVFRPFGGK